MGKTITIEDKIIKAIERQDQDLDIQTNTVEIEHCGLTYYIDYTMSKRYCEAYGGSDGYGNMEIINELVSQELYINSIVVYDDEGFETHNVVDINLIINHFEL